MFKRKIGGILFQISLLFPAAVVVMLTFDTSGTAAWCVAASAMHETGHFLALILLGSRPESVTLGLFGMRVVQRTGNRLSYRQSILVSLAGPAVNLLSFAFLFSAGGWSVPASVHFMLGAMNLMPVEPLDGGQILYQLLALWRNEPFAEHTAFAVSLCTLAPLAAAGFYVLIKSGYNFTLLVLALYLGLLLLFKRKSLS
ncbi:MAG: hypothetical protein HFJ80_02585 [Clostridiales bacterium]|nr:hypothetical protein [Clostridiales bacterium]